jgi:hypothetical protein
MPRQLNKLSARAVATLTKPGRHSDGGGLYLSISSDGDVSRRRWIFLYRWQGKHTEMGLGGLNSVSLAKARELATVYRTDLAVGTNPKEKRDKARESANGVPTFGECADSYIALKEGGWRNAKHRQQWRNTLKESQPPCALRKAWTRSGSLRPRAERALRPFASTFSSRRSTIKIDQASIIRRRTIKQPFNRTHRFDKGGRCRLCQSRRRIACPYLPTCASLPKALPSPM